MVPSRRPVVTQLVTRWPACLGCCGPTRFSKPNGSRLRSSVGSTIGGATGGLTTRGRSRTMATETETETMNDLAGRYPGSTRADLRGFACSPAQLSTPVPTGRAVRVWNGASALQSAPAAAEEGESRLASGTRDDLAGASGRGLPRYLGWSVGLDDDVLRTTQLTRRRLQLG
jgi:hypothetical protein